MSQEIYTIVIIEILSFWRSALLVLEDHTMGFKNEWVRADLCCTVQFCNYVSLFCMTPKSGAWELLCCRCTLGCPL